MYILKWGVDGAGRDCYGDARPENGLTHGITDDTGRYNSWSEALEIRKKFSIGFGGISIKRFCDKCKKELPDLNPAPDGPHYCESCQ